MIDIKVIGSGSSGNCYLANINGMKILLETGLPFKKIQKALNYKISEIDFCIITHSHKDHSKAVVDLMKHGIDVYMTDGTFSDLKIDDHHRRKRFIRNANGGYPSFHARNIIIIPFEAVHDVSEPVNFYIQDKNTKESLIFVTDTAYLKYKIPDVEVLMIECNYVKSVLDKKVDDGELNISLRNRIVRNHMSLETLLEALKGVNLKRLRKIYEYTCQIVIVTRN